MSGICASSIDATLQAVRYNHIHFKNIPHTPVNVHAAEDIVPETCLLFSLN